MELVGRSLGLVALERAVSVLQWRRARLQGTRWLVRMATVCRD